MASALDDSIGNITKALDARGMLNNTVILFTTDNGGPANGFDMNAASNVPLRYSCEKNKFAKMASFAFYLNDNLVYNL